jgi:hypothetical protein
MFHPFTVLQLERKGKTNPHPALPRAGFYLLKDRRYGMKGRMMNVRAGPCACP